MRLNLLKVHCASGANEQARALLPNLGSAAKISELIAEDAEFARTCSQLR
jgi:hypothetical protein